ncbi:hypothetical protein BTVI_22529 [Pitangus sulphuratus]|nr:hypothetical protein BTVI_22529 [Pitangus sulphuratus]
MLWLEHLLVNTEAKLISAFSISQSKLTWIFTFPTNLSLLVRTRSSTTPLYWLQYHLEKEVIVNTFQEHPGELMPCCVFPLIDIRVFEVPHEDQGLCLDSTTDECKAEQNQKRRGRMRATWSFGQNVSAHKGVESSMESEIIRMLQNASGTERIPGVQCNPRGASKALLMEANKVFGMCRKNVIPLLVSAVQCGMNEPLSRMVLYDFQQAAHPEEKAAISFGTLAHKDLRCEEALDTTCLPAPPEVPGQRRDLADGSAGALIQLVKIPLNSNTALLYTNHTSQFCIIHKFAEVHSVPASRM